MINSVYGITMENLRKRINVRLVNNAKDYKRYVSKPSFGSQNFFSKDLVIIHEIKRVLTLKVYSRTCTHFVEQKSIR